MCDECTPTVSVHNLNARIEQLEAQLAEQKRLTDRETAFSQTYIADAERFNERIKTAREALESLIEEGAFTFEGVDGWDTVFDALGIETHVEVWVTVQAQWSQRVTLPKGYDDSLIEITTEVPDYLTVTYDNTECDTELSQDNFDVTASE